MNCAAFYPHFRAIFFHVSVAQPLSFSLSISLLLSFFLSNFLYFYFCLLFLCLSLSLYLYLYLCSVWSRSVTLREATFVAIDRTTNFPQCQYGQQPWCSQLQVLIKIVLNTLDMQHHQCKRIPATVVMGGPPSRSRGNHRPPRGNY